MTKNKFGEIVLDSNDIFDHVMRGGDIMRLWHATVDQSVNQKDLKYLFDDPEFIDSWRSESDTTITVGEFDRMRQDTWFMPKHYADLDIAAYVLSLCDTDAQLQRVGQELLMFQERDLFPMLRYLKYLVDIMRDHDMVWGVGRGSSVASYVLFLMGVHRVDSLYYDLDPGEFLR
jgi:hypothetical protein